ncbi:unnamed protein product, partial [Didymodactylos carnosus]
SNWPFYFKLTFSGTPISDSDALLGEELDISLATITIERKISSPSLRTDVPLELSPSSSVERPHRSNSLDGSLHD